MSEIPTIPENIQAIIGGRENEGGENFTPPFEKFNSVPVGDGYTATFEFDEPFLGDQSTIQYNEGFEGLPYIDTRGNLSVGYGFNLEDETISSLMPEHLFKDGEWIGDEITREEAQEISNVLELRAEGDAKEYLPSYELQPAHVQEVVRDMAYNLGRGKLNEFGGMKDALEEGDFQRAAEELKYHDPDAEEKELTPYYTQTKSRAVNNYNQLISGGK